MDKDNKQKTVIVLGMHRSGTSVVAGILQILGVDMGKKFFDADICNSSGYFEDVDFWNLNCSILKKSGGDWSIPPSKENILRNKAEFSILIKRLIDGKKEKIWGWKDPRTIFTLPLYFPYIENPFFVICCRDKYDIALSLQERDGFDLQKSFCLIQRYEAMLSEYICEYSTIPKMYLSYEKNISNVLLYAEKVCSFLDIQLTDEKKSKIQKFIVPKNIIQEERKRYSLNVYNDIRALGEQIGIKDQSLALREQEVTHLRNEIVRTEDSLALREQEVTYLRNEIVRTEDSLALREQEVTHLRNEIDRKNIFIKNIFQSFSWKCIVGYRIVLKRYIPEGSVRKILYLNIYKILKKVLIYFVRLILPVELINEKNIEISLLNKSLGDS